MHVHFAAADPFPAAEHDHRHCVQAALDRAASLCAERGVRLTELRRRVLELVWEGHRPIGAYEILDRLADDRGRVAPPTVYRALEFLGEQGLVHRLDTLNAFIGCAAPVRPHDACFLICQHCGEAAEIADSALDDAVEGLARQAGFDLDSKTVELVGTCARCRGCASPAR